jgi:ubiquitin carboxyl-terminal hydrolase 7
VNIALSFFSAGMKTGVVDTRYMNSLLHALYFVPMFRKVVYQLPFMADDDHLLPEGLALALQRIFHRLQCDNQAVGTKGLRKVLEWKETESLKNTAHELDRALRDDVLVRSKGTETESTVDGLIQGRIRHFVKCIDIDYQSSREEAFTNISLSVQDCPTITRALERFTEVSILDGDNKYKVDGHGMQAAKQGCEFISLPSILHLHLKRYGTEHARFGYSPTLELGRFMAPEADQTIPPVYELFAVLIQMKEQHTSRYWACIKHKQGKDFAWLQVENTKISQLYSGNVWSASCGGAETFTNAFMLVYLRVADIPKLLAPIDKGSIPEPLKIKFEQEDAARKQKQKKKQTFVTLRIVTDADLRNGPQTDLVEVNKVIKITAKKNTTLSILTLIYINIYCSLNYYLT